MTLRDALERAEAVGALAVHVVLILPPEGNNCLPGAGSGGIHGFVSCGLNERHHYAMLGALSAVHHDLLCSGEEG